VHVGPFVEYRITAAVVWGWQPMWHGRIVPRPVLVLTLLAACALPVAILKLAVVPLAVVLVAALEAWILRRSVASAVAASTEGAVQLEDGQ